MSDNRHVDFDKGSVARVMTTAIARSHRYLVALTTAHHRGPTDTWTAARDRAAKAAGIERTYAARIWNRWQDMKDVSGEAFMRLSAAYESLCEQGEAFERAECAEAERIALEASKLAARDLSRAEERVRSTTTGTSQAPQPQARPLPPH